MTDPTAQMPPPPPAGPPPPDEPAGKPPWWKRPVPLWALILTGLIALVLGAATAGTEEEGEVDTAAEETTTTEREITTTERETTTTAEPTTARPTTTAAPTTTAPPAPPNSDEGWTLEQLSVEPDFAGDYSGTGRVRNTADTARTGVFTVTLFGGGGEVLGSMQGSAQTVGAGQVVTVEFISQDDHQPFDHFEFQTDTSFDG